jgi:hypothetical protein
MVSVLKTGIFLFSCFFLLPLAVSAARHGFDGTGAGWRSADRSSAGLLPPAAAHPGAVVRIFSAPTVRWRRIFAVHCWIVFKPEGAAGYTRYDYTAWGDPIRMNGFEPDGRWFGQVPSVVFAADGEEAAALIPPMRAAIAGYAWHNQGDYRAWPGPNSNTFVAAVIAAVPGFFAALPPNAIGKDFPADGRWISLTPSRTGIRVTLDGYAGLTIGWMEGVELNFLGGVVGLDIRRPAIKLPGLGRLGVSATAADIEPAPLSTAALPQ